MFLEHNIMCDDDGSSVLGKQVVIGGMFTGQAKVDGRL
jgi:hypothetical protein